MSENVSQSTSQPDLPNPGDYLASGPYRIIQKIGEGTFGHVYRARNIHTGEKVAVKVERTNFKQPQLGHEYQVLQRLRKCGCIEVPNVHSYAPNVHFNVMVMELLGPSLEHMFKYCKKKFSLKTVLMLAEQMLNCVWSLHLHHFVHRDLKPDNFVIGLGSHERKVYLIDMGASKNYRDFDSLSHIPLKEGRRFKGLSMFSSINSMRGSELSRRDDLECLGYILLYFKLGSLPWQNIRAATIEQRREKIYQLKMSTSLETLCRGQSPEFVKYLKYCRELAFDDTPNYPYLRELFYSLSRTNGFECDYNFDWIIRRQRNENEARQSKIFTSGYAK